MRVTPLARGLARGYTAAHRHPSQKPETRPMSHHPIAPNAADVEVATATDPVESVVDVIPVVLPVVGAVMIFLLAFIAVTMA